MASNENSDDFEGTRELVESAETVEMIYEDDDTENMTETSTVTIVYELNTYISEVTSIKAFNELNDALSYVSAEYGTELESVKKLYEQYGFIRLDSTRTVVITELTLHDSAATDN